MTVPRRSTTPSQSRGGKLIRNRSLEIFKCLRRIPNHCAPTRGGVEHAGGDLATAAASDPEGIATLAGGPSPDLTRIVQLLDAVDEARDLADRNVNPQLIVANLTRLGTGRVAGPSARPAGPGGCR